MAAIGATVGTFTSLSRDASFGTSTAADTVAQRSAGAAGNTARTTYSMNNNWGGQEITAMFEAVMSSAGRDTGFKWYTTNGNGTLAQLAMFLSGPGVLTLANLATGSLTSAAGVITSSSDERLKDISGPLEYGLEEVLHLQPIRYHWNKQSGIPTESEYGGFGAAQVEESMPLAVSYGPDGMRGLSDRVIIAALVNTIKELNARILKLEDK
jgi:hypothetical protein